MRRNIKNTFIKLIQSLWIFLLAGCGQLSQANPTLIPTITPLRLPGIPGGVTAPLVTPRPTATLGPNMPIWVANPTDRLVLKIDPASNTVASSISIKGQPDQVIAGDEGVWVLDRQGSMVYRIDPATNQVASHLPLPLGRAETMALGAGAVWVGVTGTVDLTELVPGQEPPVAPSYVLRIDPQINDVAGQFGVQPTSQLVVNGSLVWVLSRGEIDTPVQLLDINSNQGMSVPFKNAPYWFMAEAMAVDNNSLWLFSAEYGKIFHATTDGHILSMIQLDERQPTGYADLLLTDSGLWAATPWGTLLRIDPLTNHLLSTTDLGAPLTQLIAGYQTIWAVSQQTATLFRIDASNGQVVAQIPTGSRLQPTIVPSPTPRVVVWQPCPEAPTSRLKVGDMAYVTKDPPVPNRVRKDPNKDAEVLGHITPGGSMKILEGPTCAEGWVWWKVKNADLEGWTAEGDKETYWLVPLFP